MPYDRPGKIYYATNGSGGTIKHDDPVIVDGVAGTAIKQKPVSWTEGLAAQNLIQDGEAFAIKCKGIVQVPTVSGLAKGDKVYIAAASTTSGVTTFAISEVATSHSKFGVVVEVVGDGRGVPTGKVRIDLDKKDQF